VREAWKARAPRLANPASIMAQAEGSGTGVVMTLSTRSWGFSPPTVVPGTTDHEKMSKTAPPLHLKPPPSAPQVTPSSDNDVRPFIKPSPVPTMSNVLDNPACKGRPDLTVTPSVLLFNSA
jgi:hypothetical protein